MKSSPGIQSPIIELLLSKSMIMPYFGKEKRLMFYLDRFKYKELLCQKAITMYMLIP